MSRYKRIVALIPLFVGFFVDSGFIVDLTFTYMRLADTLHVSATWCMTRHVCRVCGYTYDTMH